MDDKTNITVPTRNSIEKVAIPPFWLVYLGALQRKPTKTTISVTTIDDTSMIIDDRMMLVVASAAVLGAAAVTAAPLLPRQLQ